MVEALSGVQNLIFAQAAAADGFLKIPVRRFIALHLLRGNNKIKFHSCQLFSRFGKKVVIDIGDDTQPESSGQRLQCGYCVNERLPADERFGKRAAFFG